MMNNEYNILFIYLLILHLFAIHSLWSAQKNWKMCYKKCRLLQLKIFISVALILWLKKCNLSILHYFSHFSAPLYISGTVWTTYIKWYSICLLIIHCFHVNFRQFKAFPSRWCQPSWYKFKGIGLQSPYPS